MQPINTDLTLIEDAGFSWCFDIATPAGERLPLEDYHIYGSAACPGQAPRAFAVELDTEVNAATVRMPGLPRTERPWQFQLFAQEKSSGVEWLIHAGGVNVIPRCAGAGAKLSPLRFDGTVTLDKVAQVATFVVGDNMASVAANTRLACESAKAAATSETNAGESAKAAATSETNAGESAKAAATSETNAGESAKAAATSETNAGESAKSAATNEANAKASKEAAATSEQVATKKAEAAALSAAEARRTKADIEEREAAMLEHMEDSRHHVTALEREGLQRLLQAFPEVNPDTPTTPDPTLPPSALTYTQIRDYFAKTAQPGVAQAPSAVYVSRVPWARWDGTQWVNNACAVDEAVYGVARKFMDNAGLRHTCSTDTVEGVDDYNGKLWAFCCKHGNYVTDAHGVKHVTAIKGLTVSGATFDSTKPVCAFGTAFYFFCVLERYQDPETGNWLSHDGTESGTPLFQLIGISARPFEELDEGRQAELIAHGVTAANFHLWPSCHAWDASEGKFVPRPYWCHSAYPGGYDSAEGGVLASKPGLPLFNNLGYNKLIGLYNKLAGFGGGAEVEAHGFVFDVVKNGTKDSQSIHSGMTSNNCSAVKATLSTAQADYIFPIASQKHFRVGCTVWLWQTAGSSSGGTTYIKSIETQIGRIAAIETRTLTLADGSETSSLCLVIDPDTVQPFIVRTGSDDEEAIAATKELTDEGIYACCFATQGMALTGETDTVIGCHDGARTHLTDGRHPYRVQMTEHLPGIHMCAADVVAVKGDGSVDVEIDDVVSIPDSTQYVILQSKYGSTLRTSGTLAQYIESGYEPVGLTPSVGGYIVNAWLSPSGVLYPVAVGGGGSSSSTGHADYLWINSSPAGFLRGGNLSPGASGGSASLDLSHSLSTAHWYIGARD